MQPRGKICAESEGGVNKICHFLYFLPEIHANTPKNIGKAMVAEQNREKAKRRENGMKSNNQINIPQAREAMDKFKMQAASEVGVNLTNGYNGHLTSREAGSVGGQMVKKMWPVRSVNYARPARTAIGHEVNVRYIASVTI